MVGHSVVNTPSLELIALSSVWFLSTNFWEVLSRQQQQHQRQQLRFNFSPTFFTSRKIHLRSERNPLFRISVYSSVNYYFLLSAFTHLLFVLIIWPVCYSFCSISCVLITCTFCLYFVSFLTVLLLVIWPILTACLLNLCFS